MRKQAKSLEAVASLPTADLFFYFTSHGNSTSTLPVPWSHLFYEVRVGHVTGMYDTWKEAKLQTIGVPNDVQRFKTPQ